MDSTTRELVEAYLDKARRKLEVARKLAASGDFDDAVSRAYYAAFHAVRALLASAGQNPTIHAGVVTLFNILFVKSGKVPKDLGRLFINLKDDREGVDYELFADADQALASAAIEEAKRLVTEAQRYLQTVMGPEET